MEVLSPLPIGSIVLKCEMPNDIITRMSSIQAGMSVSIPSSTQAKLAKLDIQTAKLVPEAIKLSEDTVQQSHNLLAESIRNQEQSLAKIEDEAHSVDAIKEEAEVMIEMLQGIKEKAKQLIDPLVTKDYYTFRTLKNIVTILFEAQVGESGDMLSFDNLDDYMNNLSSLESVKPMLVPGQRFPVGRHGEKLKKGEKTANSEEEEEEQEQEQDNAAEEEEKEDEEEEEESAALKAQREAEEYAKKTPLEILQPYDLENKNGLTIDELWKGLKENYFNFHIQPLLINEEELYASLTAHIKEMEETLHPPKKPKSLLKRVKKPKSPKDRKKKRDGEGNEAEEGGEEGEEEGEEAEEAEEAEEGEEENEDDYEWVPIQEGEEEEGREEDDEEEEEEEGEEGRRRRFDPEKMVGLIQDVVDLIDGLRLGILLDEKLVHPSEEEEEGEEQGEEQGEEAGEEEI
ncbi:uncharacterized protein MONOS_15110 [Monocercomonoides exilis]|uniref:uncharacterized protein n=1 Tax=Monocercomonoides exilis TaxID=2049356 RepID=UPI003559FF2A|nr:hypothetical protein MONOS_15110 [Monocercomonoides exilis]|eukprot:MONOS_15110.1-p1 / transcript=MONOS_15110.1 / gene=MONOS_15110 / organism=Monocercomonoides_exilis_PA203 / gene_product=unspecified product / transcript_product=unspecified product / location=Mono_scaffold01147:2713-4630(-) / protein_length=457 / sequence_SO=supercontig / SO=protein_coding / is_pseudo=false